MIMFENEMKTKEMVNREKQRHFLTHTQCKDILGQSSAKLMVCDALGSDMCGFVRAFYLTKCIPQEMTRDGH